MRPPERAWDFGGPTALERPKTDCVHIGHRLNSSRRTPRFG